MNPESNFEVVFSALATSLAEDVQLAEACASLAEDAEIEELRRLAMTIGEEQRIGFYSA